MSTDDKKINVDDITFDDLLSDGIQDAVEVEEPQEEIKTQENVEQPEKVVEEESLEADVEAKKEDGEKHEQVLAETNLGEPEETPKFVKPTTKTEGKETTEDDSVVSQVLEALGYKTKEAYDDTPDGLIEMTKDIGAQIAEEQLDTLLNQHPLVKNHLQFVMSGGKSEDFMSSNDPRTDFSKMEIKDDDVQSQKYVLSQYFKMKGHDNEFIKELLTDYEDTGKLEVKAKVAQKSLSEAQTKQKDQMMNQQRQMQQQKYTETKQFWDGVYNTIDKSREFKGITIPDREKTKFFDYLSKPVTKEGYTQRDVDHTSSDMDVKLAIDYLMYKGFNLDKLINTKAKTTSTKSLKERIRKHQETIKSARKVSRTPSKNVDIDDLDLSLF